MVLASGLIVTAFLGLTAFGYIRHLGPFAESDSVKISKLVRSWGIAYADRDFPALCGMYTSELQSTVRTEATGVDGKDHPECTDALATLYRGAGPMSSQNRAEYLAANIYAPNVSGNDATGYISVGDRCLGQRFQKVEERWYLGEWTHHQDDGPSVFAGTWHAVNGQFRC